MKTYTGGCHCGKVRYTAEADLSGDIISCNCSNCQMRGLLLTFIPQEQFTLLSDETDTQDYRFNKKKIAHMLCKHCGVEAFGRGTRPDGTATVALNVRCVDDVDLTTLTLKEVDGKSW